MPTGTKHVEIRRAHFYVLTVDGRVRVFSHDDLDLQPILDLDDGRTMTIAAHLNAYAIRSVREDGVKADWSTYGPWETADDAESVADALWPNVPTVRT